MFWANFLEKKILKMSVYIFVIFSQEIYQALQKLFFLKNFFFTEIFWNIAKLQKKKTQNLTKDTT